MLSNQQLKSLTTLFRLGADEASSALSKWLSRPAQISIEQVEQLPISEASSVLGGTDEPHCFCVMQMHGGFRGQLILACDDRSGFALADLLLQNPVGTSTQWGEVEQSAALETANIIGCAYLNSLAKHYLASGASDHELVPSPPTFVRDFAESLMQFALMDQAMTSDVVFLTRTEFRIEGEPVNWSLLFVPDSGSLPELRRLLGEVSDG